MDVCLREVAKVVVWRKGVRVYGSEIVVVTAGVLDVRAVDVFLTDRNCFIADVRDRVIVAVVVGIALGFGGLALEDSGEAASSWFIPIGEGRLIGFFSNGLDAVGIIVGYCWVGLFLA